MAVIALNDVVEAKLYCQSQGQISQNVYHYKATAFVGTGGTDVQFVEVFSNAFSGALKDLLCQAAEFLGASVQVIKPTRRPAVFYSTDSGVGTVAGDVCPRQVAGLIKTLSAIAGKHGRGRKYIPFPSEASNSAFGIPENAYMSLLDDFASLIPQVRSCGGGGNTTSLTPVLLDRETDATTVISSAVPRQVWATQRRRSDVRHGDLSPF